MHTLTQNAAVAIATFGVILHTGAGARREFCIAVVGEIIETKASADDVFAAAKIAADYDGMEDAERTLFRKQIQYCRAIAAGWSKLGAANQRAFVGGSLPASSAVKLLKPKAATATASEPETPSEPANDSGASGAEVITPIEMAVHLADYLDKADALKLSKAEATAIATLRASLDAFTARTAEVATRLAA